jgi:hypothetical protein
MINADINIIENNFGPIIQKFEAKKSLFQSFEALSYDEKQKRFNEDQFDKMKDWQNELNFTRPQAVSEEAFTKFL